MRPFYEDSCEIKMLRQTSVTYKILTPLYSYPAARYYALRTISEIPANLCSERGFPSLGMEIK